MTRPDYKYAGDYGGACVAHLRTVVTADWTSVERRDIIAAYRMGGEL